MTRVTASRRHRFPLRAQLLALVIPAVLLPVVVVLVENLRQEQDLDHDTRAARTAAAAFTKEVRASQESLERDTIAEDRRQMVASGRRHGDLLAQHVTWLAGSLRATLDEEMVGRFVEADVAVRAVIEPSLLARLRMLANLQNLIEIRILDTRGGTMARVDPRESDAGDPAWGVEGPPLHHDPEPVAWFREMESAVQSGKSFFTTRVAEPRPGIRLADPRSVLLAADALRYDSHGHRVDHGGAVAGYVAFTCSLEAVGAHLDEFRQRGWSASAVDSGGQPVLTGTVNPPPVAPDPRDTAEIAVPVSAPGGDPIITYRLRRGAATIGRTHDKLERIVGALQQHALHSAMTWERSISGLREARDSLLAIGLAMTIAGIVFALLGASRVTRRVEALVGAANALARGRRPEGLDRVAGADEIGVLAKRFGEMAETISERDREIRLHAARLESEVAARTEDLVAKTRALTETIAETNRQKSELEVANAQVAAALRIRTQFVANTSHEIRTPMNGIIGLSAEILELDISPEARGLAAQVQECGQFLLEILNDILDFAKVDDGRMTLESLPVRPTELAESVVAIVRHAATKKSLTCVPRVARTVPTQILTDPVRLRQVLLNLVSNAVKFTESGGVTLDITVVGEREEMTVLRFAVSDTGIGIPPERCSAIFEPFVQGDGSMTRRFGGTGLGLAISKRLVALLGGELRVESTPGRGTTFWFEIATPIVASSEADAPGPAVSAPLVELRHPDGRPLRVLIVEDNAVNRLVAERALMRLGCTSACALNGQLALDLLTTDHFDAVLMDCQMPVMDGYEATRRIRASEAPGEHLPIIALTANALATERAPCFDAGMDDFISKPFERETLAAVLARHCLKPTSPAQRVD